MLTRSRPSIPFVSGQTPGWGAPLRFGGLGVFDVVVEVVLCVHEVPADAPAPHARLGPPDVFVLRKPGRPLAFLGPLLAARHTHAHASHRRVEQHPAGAPPPPPDPPAAAPAPPAARATP